MRTPGLAKPPRKKSSKGELISMGNYTELVFINAFGNAKNSQTFLLPKFYSINLAKNDQNWPKPKLFTG